MLTLFGQPYGNPTALAADMISSAAAQHSRVCLVGDGGDEIFRQHRGGRGIGGEIGEEPRMLPMGHGVGHEAGEVVEHLLDGRRRFGHRAVDQLAKVARREVGALMRLFLEALDREVNELLANGVRLRFIGEFTPYFEDAMRGVIGDREIVTLDYRSSVDIDPDADDAVARYLETLGGRLFSDMRRGTTSVGPHRDDMDILLNGLDVRAQASQGQHKSVLISLKLGEYRFLDAHLDEAPILLLDDVFSELDDDRLERVLHLVQGLGQTFITTANMNTLRFFSRNGGDNLTLRIDNGVVSQLAEVA